MSKWVPNSTGSGNQWSLSPTLQPLANVKDKLTICSGLNNRPAVRPGGDHAAGTAAFMTAVHINNSQTDLRNGKSVDQHIADAIGNNSRIKSMQLGIDSPSICDSTFSCAYSRSISWASASQPLSKTVNPRTVFNQLFAGIDQSVSVAELSERERMDKSILDYVLAQTQALNSKLGYTDRAKLDEYLTGIRELEQRIARNQPLTGCNFIPEPDANLNLQEQIDVMTDLMVLAMQCEQSNVISFMLADGLSGRNHSFIDASGGHHELSHHRNRDSQLEKLAKIDFWEVQQLAKLLDKMDAIQEGDGTLLDNSLVYFSSELSDGDSHSHNNMPIVLAGGVGGHMQGNRHVNFNGQKVANMFISMMAQYGLNFNQFGDDGDRQLNGLFS